MLAGYVLWRDWRKHRRGEPIVPVRRWVSRARRLLGRPWRGSGTPADDVLVTDAVTAELTTGWDADADVHEQLWLLNRSVNLLSLREAEHHDEASAKFRELENDRDSIARDVTDVREQLTDVATGSVRLELLGLVLVGIGTVLSAFGGH